MPDVISPSRLAVLLFTDLVGSTEHKNRLGTMAYTRLLARHDDIFRQLINSIGHGTIIKDTGDGYFAVFTTVSDAVNFALRFQAAMHNENWNERPLRTRIGINIGEVAEMAPEEAGNLKIVGTAADLAARITALAQGEQILMTRFVFDEARQFIHQYPGTDGKPIHLKWVAHGDYLFKGVEEKVEIFEVGGEGIGPLSPPSDTLEARRVVPHDQEQTLGWRPAVGLNVPQRSGWILEKKLGEGAFGEVWLARHDRTKQHRVFKFCFDADRLRSFKRELTLFRLLREALGDRADIAQLFDVKLDEPPFFLESEYTEGGNLITWGEAQGGLDKVPLAQRLAIVAQVATAIAAAHSVGILHKDIKPGNILINVGADGTPSPRIADFGIGILTDPGQLASRHITATGFTTLTENESSRTGTRMYAPPEMLTGKPFTIHGDIYSLGVLLFQLVVGDIQRPLAPGWERDVSDDFLRGDIAACVEGDPARRLHSAAELAMRLNTLPQRRDEKLKDLRLREGAQRRRRVVRIAAVAAAICVIISSIAILGFLRERQLRKRAEASERKAQLAGASATLEQATALHLAGRGQESRTAFTKARDQFQQLGESTREAEVGLYRSFREFTAPINTLRGHTDGLMAAAWLPDGRRAVSVAGDGAIKLWDVPTGCELRTFSGHNGLVGGVAVSPDGKQILSGGWDGTVRLWDVESGQQIKSLGEPTGEVRGVAFSIDGRLAMAGTVNRPGLLRLWEVDSGKLIYSSKGPDGQAIYAVAFAPDGKHFLVTTYEKSIWIFDVLSKAPIRQLSGHTGYVISAAFSPDSRQILSASFDQTLRLWDVASGTEVRVFRGHSAGVRGVAYVGADRALSCSMDGTLKLWNLQSAEPIATFAGHTDGVRGVAVSPDGRRAISAGMDATLDVWDLAANSEVRTCEHSSAAISFSCSPDGRTFAAGDFEGELKLHDFATLRTLQTFKGNGKAVETVKILPDGRRLFAAENTGAAKVWDIASGRELRSFPARTPANDGYIRGREWCYTAVAGDGTLAVSSEQDRRTMDVWNIESGNSIRKIGTTKHEITALAISPDQKHVVSGDDRGEISYWDLNSGQLLFSTPAGAKEGAIDALAFSSDGKRLLSGGHDLVMRLWQFPSGKRIREFAGHTLVVTSVGFGPGGQTVYSAATDQTFKTWSVDTGRELGLGAQFALPCYALATIPPGDVVLVASKPTIGVWDFSRPLRYQEFSSRLDAARTSLRSNPHDAAALTSLGQWYAFRGVHDWAAQLMESARAAGGDVSPLLLARCYWQLDRYEEAAREFRSALGRNEAPAEYLNLCLEAVSKPSATTQPSRR